MTPHIAAAPGDRARALSWTVTETPERLGLRGHRYHYPRFDVRRQDASTRRPETDGRHG